MAGLGNCYWNRSSYCFGFFRTGNSTIGTKFNPGFGSKFINNFSRFAKNGCELQGGFGSSQTLTLDDANAIAAAHFASISQVSPEVSRRGQVTAGRNNTNTSIIGATSAYPEVHNVTMSSGTFITTEDVNGIRNVAVIGPQRC